ncbi:hypothetical protein ACLOJK_018553 [Asimina triloba]
MGGSSLLLLLFLHPSLAATAFSSYRCLSPSTDLVLPPMCNGGGTEMRLDVRGKTLSCFICCYRKLLDVDDGCCLSWSCSAADVVEEVMLLPTMPWIVIGERCCPSAGMDATVGGFGWAVDLGRISTLLLATNLPMDGMEEALLVAVVAVAFGEDAEITREDGGRNCRRSGCGRRWVAVEADPLGSGVGGVAGGPSRRQLGDEDDPAWTVKTWSASVVVHRI